MFLAREHASAAALLVLLLSIVAGSAGSEEPPVEPSPQGATHTPPMVTILSPLDGALVDHSDLTVRVAIRSPTGDPVTAVRVLVNGKLAPPHRGVVIENTPPVPSRARPGEGEHQLIVSLPGEDCTVAVVAETALAKGEPAVVHLRWAGKSMPVKPNLYMLAVGISKYRKSELRLEYSDKDAKDLAAEFSKQQGKLYRQAEVRVLADRDATKDHILDGLEWLQKRTRANDVAVLFLSGHGITTPDTGEYYYLPYDADTEAIKRTMIFGGEIKSTLDHIPGKVLLFLDTCHAGNVLGPGLFRGPPEMIDLTPFVHDLTSAENGIAVFASSTGRQPSKESPLWRNGAFTRALVEGLRGRAAIDATRRITVDMLDLYVSEHVKRLTQGLQTPTTTKAHLADFPVAIGEEKPLPLPFYAPPLPLYKKWWLWAAMGAVATVTVGLAVGLTRPPSFPDNVDVWHLSLKQLTPFQPAGR